MIMTFLARQWPLLTAGLSALALLGYAAYQRDRANDAEALASSRAETIQFQTGVITDYAASIEAQNEAIKGLADRREEGRVIYLQDYARADERAKSFDLRASELLSQQTEFTDELAECRATKTLLEQEMTP